ncbi:MAG: tyrosine-type recombinase/integrase [Eubacterium sp.]
MEAEDISLSEAMLIWLEKTKKPELKPSSFMRLYLTVTKQILPRIGSCAVDDLTVPYIEDTLISGMFHDGQSQSSIKKAKSAMSNFYRHYLIHSGKYKETNFMTYIHVPRAAAFGEAKHIGYLTDPESSSFLHACILDGSIPALALAFMLNTGLRVGECIALKWDDYDSRNHILNVRRNAITIADVDMHNRKRLKEHLVIQSMPKTINSFRRIPLNEFCINLLKDLGNKQLPVNTDQFIFPSTVGTVIWPNNLRRKAASIMDSINIPREKHGLHILRHTYATALFAQGIDLKTVSYLLGHSTIQITADNYIHIAEAFRYEIAERKFRPFPERFLGK